MLIKSGLYEHGNPTTAYGKSQVDENGIPLTLSSAPVLMDIAPQNAVIPEKPEVAPLTDEPQIADEWQEPDTGEEGDEEDESDESDEEEDEESEESEETEPGTADVPAVDVSELAAEIAVKEGTATVEAIRRRGRRPANPQ